MSEPYILCIACRGTFTEEQTKGWGCPTCGNTGVPADTRKKATLTLTHHEWRVLFMFAENWAAQCERNEERPSMVLKSVQAITREAQRQAPDVTLTLLGEIKKAVNTLGLKADLHGPDGVETIEPEKKH